MMLAFPNRGMKDTMEALHMRVDLGSFVNKLPSYNNAMHEDQDVAWRSELCFLCSERAGHGCSNLC